MRNYQGVRMEYFMVVIQDVQIYGPRGIAEARFPFPAQQDFNLQKLIQELLGGMSGSCLYAGIIKIIPFKAPCRRLVYVGNPYYLANTCVNMEYRILQVVYAVAQIASQRDICGCDLVHK